MKTMTYLNKLQYHSKPKSSCRSSITAFYKTFTASDRKNNSIKIECTVNGCRKSFGEEITNYDKKLLDSKTFNFYQPISREPNLIPVKSNTFSH